jgi:hypothetical protein
MCCEGDEEEHEGDEERREGDEDSQKNQGNTEKYNQEKMRGAQKEAFFLDQAAPTGVRQVQERARLYAKLLAGPWRCPSLMTIEVGPLCIRLVSFQFKICLSGNHR